MVLHGEGGERLVPDAFDGAVVEIYVRNFEAFGHRFRNDGEVVVLACNLHLVCREILDGMVAAVMPELEPRRFRAAGERKKLMPEADAHDGQVFKCLSV